MAGRPTAASDSAAVAAEPETSGPATPEKGKPVVLKTRRTHEFVIPGEKKDGDLVVTSAGVALSKADAEKVKKAAKAAGVDIFETENDKDDN